MKKFTVLGSLFVLLAGCAPASTPTQTPASSSSSSPVAIAPKSVASSKAASVKSGCYPGSCGIPPMSDAEVKAIVSPETYKIMRKAGTEAPYSSPLNDEHRAGTFVATDTGEPLFRSETKFDSGTGWPSFYAPISPNVLVENTDSTLGIARTEILTRNGSHLGHVFEDGPQPTGLRYCMNGLALRFIPDTP